MGLCNSLCAYISIRKLLLQTPITNPAPSPVAPALPAGAVSHELPVLVEQVKWQWEEWGPQRRNIHGVTLLGEEMMGRSKKWFQGLEKMHLELPRAQKEGDEQRSLWLKFTYPSLKQVTSIYITIPKDIQTQSCCHLSPPQTSFGECAA